MVRPVGRTCGELLLFYIPLVNQLGVEAFYWLVGCGLALARHNEATQAVLYKVCPCFVTHFETFILGDEALVGEANFSFLPCLCDFKDHLCILPLALVLCEVEIVVEDVPYHFLFGDELDDLDPAEVDVFVMIDIYAVELVGDAFYAFGPPSARVVDGGECFSGSLVYLEAGGEILLFHNFIFWVYKCFSEIKAIYCL